MIIYSGVSSMTTRWLLRRRRRRRRCRPATIAVFAAHYINTHGARRDQVLLFCDSIIISSRLPPPLTRIHSSIACIVSAPHYIITPVIHTAVCNDNKIYDYDRYYHYYGIIYSVRNDSTTAAMTGILGHRVWKKLR